MTGNHLHYNFKLNTHLGNHEPFQSLFPSSTQVTMTLQSLIMFSAVHAEQLCQALKLKVDKNIRQ